MARPSGPLLQKLKAAQITRPGTETKVTHLKITSASLRHNEEGGWLGFVSTAIQDIVTRKSTDEERRRQAFFHWTTQLRLAYNRDAQAIEEAKQQLERFHDLLGESGIPSGRDAV